MTTIQDIPLKTIAGQDVAGDDRHPLYAALTAQPDAISTNGGGMREKLAGYGITPNPEPEILWNFEKFLISRDGEVIARFAPIPLRTIPQSSRRSSAN